VGVTFTIAVLFGMKGISNLAVFNVSMFSILACLVFFFGPTKFILESSISGFGNMVQNFIGMATWMDPLRLSGDGTIGFPQSLTVFYWAYWIAWSVCTPFFVATISEGRSLRNMIFGAFFYGIAGTFVSFMVFGNFGLSQQVSGAVDTMALTEAGMAPADIITQYFGALPFPTVALALLALVMIAFYASTFDAITLVIAGFTKKNGIPGGSEDNGLRVFWAVVLVILPITLIWSESTRMMLQTVSIIAAFPVAIIMLIVSFGFLRDLRKEKI
jgi:BCCT family betaine/carnitine transporter